MKIKTCREYVGVACINGNCPIANRDEYVERGYPVVDSCADCHFNLGCEDCYFDPLHCDKGYCDKNCEKI